MANKAFTVEQFELQDGTEVTIKPLVIAYLREFMEEVEKLEGVKKDVDAIDHMREACAIALRKDNPELANDPDRLEEVLDMPTMWKILEIAGGIQMDANPNLQKAVSSGQS